MVEVRECPAELTMSVTARIMVVSIDMTQLGFYSPHIFRFCFIVDSLLTTATATVLIHAPLYLAADGPSQLLQPHLDSPRVSLHPVVIYVVLTPCIR